MASRSDAAGMQEFDFVVVGSGSAGSALAERLSRDGRFSVAVLEAGGTDRRFFVQMPLGYGKTFYDPRVNWNFTAEPDPGLAGNADHWPRGKLLGGSSSVNAMVWIRGQPADFDAWAQAGNPGWSFADLLPIFREIETNEAGADAFRGSGGPVHVSDNREKIHPLTRRFLQAAQAAGLPLNPDFNGSNQEGVGVYQITTRNGRRMSAARAFLRPAMKRGNVRVETGALVTRIVFDGNRAAGVEFERRGRRLRVSARREVILCAGAVSTPLLLQLSGVGPEELLQRHGIPVRLAQPQVGRNLVDHQGINYTWKGSVPTLNQILRPWWGKAYVGAQYLLARRGPLSMSMNQGGGFFRTSADQARPNMQLYFQAFSTVLPRPGERPILSPDPWPGFSIGLSNCRPTSRGTIEIRSADPHAPPRIVPNAFSTAHDVEEMLLAVKFLRRIAAAEPIAEIVREEMLPGSQVQSDEALIADFRQRSGTVYHPVGTCRMGPDANTAVVDARLRVHGLGHLRIVDCSIFPGIVSGNTNAAAIVTGVKGGDLILADHRP